MFHKHILIKHNNGFHYILHMCMSYFDDFQCPFTLSYSSLTPIDPLSTFESSVFVPFPVAVIDCRQKQLLRERA